MPILKNAKKALRVSRRKEVINRRLRSRTKTMIDKMSQEPSVEQLSQTFSSIDRAVKRNIFHKNKAARLKSQMSRLIAKS
jgi:small subunit ribosomal protein S20